jgi:hypothetical protein
MFKLIRTLGIGSLLALVIFMAISFLTILVQMPPFRYTDHFPHYMGFPFSYYDQFWLTDNCTPHYGWSIRNLVVDALLTWLLVTGTYLLFKARKSGRKVTLSKTELRQGDLTKKILRPL